MIRLVGLSASPRRANTEILVKEALQASQELGFGVETEFVSLAGKKIEPCTDCKACVKNKSYCVKKDHWLEVVQPLINPVPDGVIIGSPVYFFSTPSLLRAFFERCTSLLKAKWEEDFPHPPPDWTKTAGGAIAVGYDRHGGQELTLTNILHWLLTNGFVAVGGDYIGGGAWQQFVDAKDSVKNDEVGLEAARRVGRRVGLTA
ncbi:MAG: flavodoxin family protein, partial [Deltaproteobacteria bacterium]|nr:flavodoxin family protein [Deltaproteobacteria bacterium]